MFLLGDCKEVLKYFKHDTFDLTVTSPPYDDLRSYQGNSKFDFNSIAQELYRVTKQGGVVVWIVGDATINGSETGTSFKQALYFKEIGFNLHDTMIYAKNGFVFPSHVHKRYHQTFEYMFILSKGKPKTFNPIKDKPNSTHLRKPQYRHERNKQTGRVEYRKDMMMGLDDYGIRYNIWNYPTGSLSINHPAIFPEKLAEDHILSWSNEGDLVLDPFCGSGTTYKACIKLNRHCIGIEINKDYIEIAKERVKPLLQQTKIV